MVSSACLPSPWDRRPRFSRLAQVAMAGFVLCSLTVALLPGEATAQTQQHPAQQQAPATKPAVKPATPSAPATKPEPAKAESAKAEPAKTAPDSPAATGVGQPEGSSSNLPLPRFVSLRSDQVNMRAGPGARYPVDWVYMRRELPVEVIQEYETWRKIRDPDGAEGWVHQSMLTGRRTIMVRKDKSMLRRTADDTASAAAFLAQGVIGKLLQCPKGSDYCRVEVEGYQGWLRRNELWGAYKAEAIN